MTKYLDQAGVQILWTKTKEKIASEVAGAAVKDHTHEIADVNGLQAALDGKQAKLTFDDTPTASSSNPVKSSGIKTALDGKANATHNHAIADITNLQTSLDAKVNKSDVIDEYQVGQGTGYEGKVSSVKGVINYVADNVLSQKGKTSGFASLGSDGKVPSSQLPSYVDDVLEFENRTAFPQTGEDGKIYIAEDTNKQYRWSGSAYVEISSSLALGETASTAYAGDKGKANADNIAALQSGKADKTHTHAISDITDLQTTLDNKVDKKVGTSQIAISNTEVRIASNEQVLQLNNGATKYAQLSSGDFLLRISADNKTVVGNGVVNHELLNDSMALTEDELNDILV